MLHCKINHKNVPQSSSVGRSNLDLTLLRPVATHSQSFKDTEKYKQLSQHPSIISDSCSFALLHPQRTGFSSSLRRTLADWDLRTRWHTRPLRPSCLLQQPPLHTMSSQP